jgi:7-carboxy-7-deazaguanine synthase
MYRVNEIFYSLQGEGRRVGEPSVFLRFAGCNLACSMDPGPISPGGFDCDTEFASGISVSAEEIRERLLHVSQGCRKVILTGGEPLLQADNELGEALKNDGWFIAVETNGTIFAPEWIDWISLSPKVAEHAIRTGRADELRYVRAHGQGIPKPTIPAKYKYLSPPFSPSGLSQEDLAWCQSLCLKHHEWSLSVQAHKMWRIR